MNDRMIMLKAGNIGFDALRVTQARFDCCGAIVKYRTGKEAKDIGGYGMNCPYCDGQGEFEPHSWNLDYGPEIEYAHQPEGYPDINMGQIEDDMRDMLENTEAEMGEDTYYCEHCGHDEASYAELKDIDPDRYHEELSDRMGYDRVACPMCQYGEYSDLQDHAHQVDDRSAAQWAKESGELRYDPDAEITAERIMYGQGDIDNPLRGRPTRGQMRARKRLRDLPAMGYDSLGEVPYGKELEDAVEMYNRKYGPSSLDQPLFTQEGHRAGMQRLAGPTMPELRVPRYDRDKDRLLQGGY
tara:strand:- start:1367 stop:2260 length:894 start_codon:yes stop_codon:yes gene_type:complete